MKKNHKSLFIGASVIAIGAGLVSAVAQRCSNTTSTPGSQASVIVAELNVLSAYSSSVAPSTLPALAQQFLIAILRQTLSSGGSVEQLSFNLITNSEVFFNSGNNTYAVQINGLTGTGGLGNTTIISGDATNGVVVTVGETNGALSISSTNSITGVTGEVLPGVATIVVAVNAISTYDSTNPPGNLSVLSQQFLAAIESAADNSNVIFSFSSISAADISFDNNIFNASVNGFRGSDDNNRLFFSGNTELLINSTNGNLSIATDGLTGLETVDVFETIVSGINELSAFVNGTSNPGSFATIIITALNVFLSINSPVQTLVFTNISLSDISFNSGIYSAVIPGFTGTTGPVGEPLSLSGSLANASILISFSLSSAVLLPTQISGLVVS